MATANMKDVKRRIKSVESTMQITKAMQLVAASKLRRAKDKAVAVQPFLKRFLRQCAIYPATELSSRCIQRRSSLIPHCL